MARLLDPVLDTRHLPLAELWAATRDGELVALGDGFVPPDAPIGCELRARAVASTVGPSLIADRLTAAWVYGAAMTAPAVLQLCVSRQSRLPFRPQCPAVVREVRLIDQDVRTIGGLQLTGRVRTAYDLLLADAYDAATEQVVAALLADGRVPACWARLRVGSKIPGRRRAFTRLEELSAGQAMLPGRRRGDSEDGPLRPQPSLTR